MINVRKLGSSSLALLALRDCGVIRANSRDVRYRDLCAMRMATMDEAGPQDRGALPGKADFRITPKGEAALKRELALIA